MDSRQSAPPVDPPEPKGATGDPLGSLRDSSPGRESRFATPVIGILAVICCTGPLLVGVLATTGAGTWLAAHGYTIGTAALVVLAALLTWGIRARLSRG